MTDWFDQPQDDAPEEEPTHVPEMSLDRLLMLVLYPESGSKQDLLDLIDLETQDDLDGTYGEYF